MTVSMVDIPTNFHDRECLRDLLSSNMNIAIDAKERADRMAAAEAMSALSAVVVTHGEDIPSSPRTSKRLASKSGRGGGRGRGRKSNTNGQESNSDTKKSRSRTRTNHDTTNSNVTGNPRNRTGRVTSKSKDVNTLEQGIKRSPRRRSKASLSEIDSPLKSRTRTISQSSDYGDMPVLEPQVTKPSSTPSLPSLPSLPNLPSNMTLTLPSLNIPSLVTLPTLGSLSLFQSDAASEIQPKKQDNKNLPFKKRRLINSDQGGEDSEDQETKSEKSLAADTVPRTPSLSGKIQIDPSQQVRLFGEIQAALTADEDGDIPLHLAVVHEHLPLVQKFIQLMRIARRSVDRFNKDKQTPLHLAVKLDFKLGVKALLEAGADVNFVDKTGCTSLHLAVRHEFPDCLKMLVEGSKVEADFNTRNFEGLTPLHTAVELRNMQLMAYILDRGADINMMDGKSGRTALFHAAENNEEEVVEFLLKRSANPDVLNYAGSTAMMAAQARNYNIVTKMLSRASEWVDDDRSGSSSPASEISVYVPDGRGPKQMKQSHSLRNTSQPGPSHVDESQPKLKTKITENNQHATSRSPGKLVDAASETVTSFDGSVKGSSVSSCQTPIHYPKQVSKSSVQTATDAKKTTAPSRGEIVKEPDKQKASETKGEKKQPGLINSEFNNLANLKAISELAKRSPQVAHELQKLYEAKQKQQAELVKKVAVKASVSPKSGSPTVPRSGSMSPRSASSLSAESTDSATDRSTDLQPYQQSVTTSRSSTVTMETVGLPRVVSAPSQVIGKVSHVVDKQQPERIISTGMVVQHPEYGLVFRPFGPGGTIQHLHQAGPREGEANGNRETGPPKTKHITGTVIIQDRPGSSENKEISDRSEKLSFHRNHGPGTMNKQGTPSNSNSPTPSNINPATPDNSNQGMPSNSNQGKPSNSNQGTPSAGSSCQATPNKDSSVEIPGNHGDVSGTGESGKDAVSNGKDMTNDKSGDSLKNKDVIRILQKAQSISDALREKTQIGQNPEAIIPLSAVSSHPVTEKLLNSKPRSPSVPKLRASDSSFKSQDAPKSETVSTIAKSAIAAKLRQRVLNSPHVDSATKALTNQPVQTVPTTQPRGIVTSAPERVPKLPQFGPRHLNIQPSPQSTTDTNEVTSLAENASAVAENISKTDESFAPVAVDQTKQRPGKTKKPEKRKKKESINSGRRKKSALSKEGKGHNSGGKTISEPMDTS